MNASPPRHCPHDAAHATRAQNRELRRRRPGQQVARRDSVLELLGRKPPAIVDDEPAEQRDVRRRPAGPDEPIRPHSRSRAARDGTGVSNTLVRRRDRGQLLGRGQHPHVSAVQREPAVVRPEQLRLPVAVRGRDERVGRAGDDLDGAAAVANTLHLQRQVERVHFAGQPERRTRSSEDPADRDERVDPCVPGRRDLPGEVGEACGHRLLQRQARGRDEREARDPLRPSGSGEHRERPAHRVAGEPDVPVRAVELRLQPGPVRAERAARAAKPR